MLTVLAALAALAVLFAAGALITHEGDVLRDAPADAPDLDLPIGQLQPEDVPQLRFGLALRGYRMDEVDATLARVAGELTARDQHIAQLQQALATAVEPAPAEVEQQVAEPVQHWALNDRPAAEPEQAAWPPAPVAQPEPEQPPWPEQEWPEVTSVVAENARQVPAPTPEPIQDLFPEISPPEPDVQGLPDATDDEAPASSSFGLYDQDEDPPLGQPGVGFAASGGAPADPV